MTKKNRSARRTFLSVLMFMLSLANFLPTFNEIQSNLSIKTNFRWKPQESNLKEIDL